MSSRASFTPEDRLNLAKFLVTFPQQDHLKPSTHKAMARRHPEHSDQSWLEHYKRSGKEKVDYHIRTLEKAKKKSKAQTPAAAAAAPVASTSKAKRAREPSSSPSDSTSDESDSPPPKQSSKRVKYTDEHRSLLVDMLESGERKGLARGRVYENLEEKCPDHSAQSWQTYHRDNRSEIDNAVKAKAKVRRKKNFPRPKSSAKAKVAEGAKALGSGAKAGTSAKGKGKMVVLSDSDSDEEIEFEEVAVKKAMVKEAPKSVERESSSDVEVEVEDAAPEVYTDKDDTILVLNVARAELKGLNRDNVWVALANKYPQHSAERWKARWMQDVGTFVARVATQIAEILKTQAGATASSEKAATKPKEPKGPVVEPESVDNGAKVKGGVKVEEDIDEPTTQEDDEELDQLADDSSLQHFPAPLSRSSSRPSTSQAPIAQPALPSSSALAGPPLPPPDVTPPTPSASPQHESQERDRLAARKREAVSPPRPLSSLPSPYLKGIEAQEEMEEVEDVEEDQEMEEDELDEDDRRVEASLLVEPAEGVDGWPPLEGAELEFVEGTYVLLDSLAKAEKEEEEREREEEERQRERLRREAEEEEARRAAEREEERRVAEAEERRIEEEKQAKEARIVAKAQRDARKKAEMEAAARTELEERQKAFELEVRRKEEVEAKKLAKIEAQKKAEDEARIKAELEAEEEKAAKEKADLKAKRKADRKKAASIPPPEPSSSKAISEHRKETKHPTPSSSAVKLPPPSSAPHPIPAAVARLGKRPRASSAAMSEAPDPATPVAKKARLDPAVPIPSSSTKPVVLPLASAPETKVSLKDELAEYGRRYGFKTRPVMSLYFACGAPLNMTILEDALTWYSSRRPAPGTEAHHDLELRIGRTIWTYDEDVVVLQGSEAEKKAIEARKGRKSIKARMKFLQESEKTTVEALGAPKWPFV